MQASGAEIMVSAAASLKEALTGIAAIYEQQSEDTVVLNFAGSNVLARQIEAGVPVDLFFSADETTMNRLEALKLLEPGSRRPILGNSLVIVVPKDSTLSLSTPADLSSPALKRLVLADPAIVPAGIYARLYLEKSGLWDDIETKTIPAANVRAALAAVASGNADAGIVYKTDAAISDRVKIACAIPPDAEIPIIYPVAQVRNGQAGAAARSFLVFIQGPAARKIFENQGFQVLGAQRMESESSETND